MMAKIESEDVLLLQPNEPGDEPWDDEEQAYNDMLDRYFDMIEEEYSGSRYVPGLDDEQEDKKI